MLLDAENLYSDAQALTVTAASTNYIDHLSDRNLGIGEPLAVQITLDVAATDDDSDETYSFAIQTDDNSSFSSATTLGTITVTRGAAAGAKYVFLIPMDTQFERYSRIYYTLGGTTPTVTVTSALVPAKMIQQKADYASGFTVS